MPICFLHRRAPSIHGGLRSIDLKPFVGATLVGALRGHDVMFDVRDAALRYQLMMGKLEPLLDTPTSSAHKHHKLNAERSSHG
ncbi:hypothetical protein WI845_16675 [Vibrio cholerae]